jgi:hypothetical protein
MNSAHPSLSRRRVLAALGSGAAVMLLAACGAARPSAATTATTGGADMQQYEDVVTPLMTGKLTVRDALGQMQQRAQLVLDKNLAKARSLAG